MADEYAKHETDFIAQYQKKGFTDNYHFEKGTLIDSKTNRAYSPDQIFIVAEHRYEGMSDPSDMAILYVIETKDHSKGTFLLGYGPTADLEIADFFKQVPKQNYSDKESINKKE
jgi:hypothetical protein